MQTPAGSIAAAFRRRAAALVLMGAAAAFLGAALALSPSLAASSRVPASAAAPDRAAALARQQRPPEGSVIRLETQRVTLSDFPAEGLILDIGGGGEGVIGQLKGDQVVAIDLIKRELEDAPGEPLLKIVMDARSMGFLDDTFPTATVFFTFMYIPGENHAQVFSELFRVLTPGGRLLIWDAEFPQARDEAKSYALFPLFVQLPDKQIETGYGVRLPAQGTQGLDHYLELASQAGFQVVFRNQEQNWFHLELRKPDR